MPLRMVTCMSGTDSAAAEVDAPVSARVGCSSARARRSNADSSCGMSTDRSVATDDTYQRDHVSRRRLDLLRELFVPDNKVAQVDIKRMVVEQQGGPQAIPAMSGMPHYA